MEGKVPKRFIRTQGEQNRWQTTLEEVNENAPQSVPSHSWKLVNGNWQKVTSSGDQLVPPDTPYNPTPDTPYNPPSATPYNPSPATPYNPPPPPYPADQYSSSPTDPLLNYNHSSLPYAVQPGIAPSAPPLSKY